jgi:hypothetical protein
LNGTSDVTQTEFYFARSLITGPTVTASCHDITIQLSFPKLFAANKFYPSVSAAFPGNMRTLKDSGKVFKA